jgi:hypothetical protein
MDIKHRVTGKVLFSCDKKTLKEVVIEAVDKKAYLRGTSGEQTSGASQKEPYPQ